MTTDFWLTIGMSNAYTPGFQDTSRLMTRAVDGKVGYIEPPKPLSAWKLPNRRVLSWSVRETDGMTVFSPPLPVPRKVDPLRFALSIQASNLNRRLSRALSPDWREKTIVYVTNWSYYQQPLIERLQPRHIVFDIVDDVLAFPYDFDRQRVLAAWRWLAKHAAVNVSVSPVLQQLTRDQLGVEAICLPNGVDAKHFSAPAATLPEQVVIPEHNALNVGFAGTLNHWIDFGAMLDMLERLPYVHLYLMGRTGNIPDSHQQSAFTRLQSHERAHWVGNVDYEQLPAVLHRMDVLLLPRIASAASESSSPLKLYEYLAVGKPIVIAGVPVPADMTDLVYLANDDLTRATENACLEVRGDREALTRQRQDYAERHTWKARVRAIQSLLEERTPDHQA